MEKFKFLNKQKINRLPKSPGVYAFSTKKEILYIGKAIDIRERIKQHKNLLGLADQLGYIKTGSEIQALILEANLIKEYRPKYNTVWKDDKNYFYVAATKEDFPQIFITHQTKIRNLKLATSYLGPFVDGKALKQTLKVLRKAFPYRSCKKMPNQPCLWHQLNYCPAPCLFIGKKDKISLFLNKKMNPVKNRRFLNGAKKEYQKNIKGLVKILKGGKNQALTDLKKEMKQASASQDYEAALKTKNQILALEKILANSKIFEKTMFPNKDVWPEKTEKDLKKLLKTAKDLSRIEAYDISNIQGQEAAGAMVAFVNGRPNKDFYRKFKIKIKGKPNDVAMLKETLARRLAHAEWGLPDLILIDGGKAQLNAALEIVNNHEPAKAAVSRVLALAKRKNELFIQGRKRPVLLKNLPKEIANLMLYLRDEAHRFALAYHHKLRAKDFIK